MVLMTTPCDGQRATVSWLLLTQHNCLHDKVFLQKLCQFVMHFFASGRCCIRIKVMRSELYSRWALSSIRIKNVCGLWKVFYFWLFICSSGVSCWILLAWWPVWRDFVVMTRCLILGARWLRHIWCVGRISSSMRAPPENQNLNYCFP